MTAPVISGGKALVTDEVIECFIYDQEGTLQPMRLPNNRMTQYFVQWLQRHDRYTRGGKEVEYGAAG